jgi:hypothetical protein
MNINTKENKVKSYAFIIQMNYKGQNSKRKRKILETIRTTL